MHYARALHSSTSKFILSAAEVLAVGCFLPLSAVFLDPISPLCFLRLLIILFACFPFGGRAVQYSSTHFVILIEDHICCGKLIKLPFPTFCAFLAPASPHLIYPPILVQTVIIFLFRDFLSALFLLYYRSTVLYLFCLHWDSGSQSRPYKPCIKISR